MLGGDRGLQRVGAHGPRGERGRREREALVDLRAVPARAVLILEQHELAVRRRARLAARVVEQHQREQAARLGRAGKLLGEQAPEADRLLREIRAHERVAAASPSSPR